MIRKGTPARGVLPGANVSRAGQVSTTALICGFTASDASWAVEAWAAARPRPPSRSRRRPAARKARIPHPRIALHAYDRVGLVLDQIAIDGALTKAPGGG
ncbi:hypothetical protein Sgleb_66330 [Streptomyces glebosus]|uniref:Uncharacterized protein n=1 Tax=Streptomyces glebosus TaxID=249580 RepID=A0A640T8H8_9ACTN|nr:hypothetical protein Sgleb_66330 [Streptomyces glebosus]GHG80846.1 hypothetical protein GCM10010513_59090 [Streptomyces glebosus]